MFDAVRIPYISPFWKKRKIIVYFMDEAGRVYKTKRKYTENKFVVNVHGRKETYLIDQTRMLMDPKQNVPVIFYYVGYPHAIKFDHKVPTDKADAPSSALTEMLDNKSLKDLITKKGQNYLKYILVASVIGAGASIFLLAKTMGWI